MLKIPILASKIDLSNLGLTEIPRQIFECKNLKKLNLSNNRIKVIPPELAELKYLKNLDLSNNEISVLYSKNFSFQSLEVLILNNNQIKTIPKQISNLGKLKKLSLGRNSLKELPDTFEKLIGLTSLNIAGNEFKQFPRAILALEALNSLWLNNNAFSDFPIFDIRDKLINLRSFYSFSSINNSLDGIDLEFKKLRGFKGNSISQLNLLSIKSKTKPLSLKMEMTTPPSDKTKTSIFISYCHIDNLWLNKLTTVLKTMEYEGLEFERWDDTRLRTGDLWKKEIETAILNANVAILLVSNDFLASKFIQEKEVPELLSKARSNGTKILPIIVGRCRFTQSILKDYQSVNSPEKPLRAISQHEQDEVFYKLTLEIDNILNE